MARFRDSDFGSHARGHERASRASDHAQTKPQPDPISITSPNEAIVWNELMLQAIALSSSSPSPLIATRVMAIESLAVFNALSSIEGGASAVAAVAQAARDVLVQLFPAQSATFDALLASSLGAIADGEAKSDGIAAGAQAAADMIETRADDGWNASVPYTPTAEPGRWQPTPPAHLPAAAPQWGDVEPFALLSSDQFLPKGPPALTSRGYAKAFHEVQSLGEADSALRTPEQTEIAKFWVFGARTPPGAWNDIASDIAQAEGLSLTETARLLATLNVAEADAMIAVWDAKYFYDTWRPVTAIRNADDIGNRWISEDPDWTPLLTTPNHPEYVSGHSTISAAAAEVLTAYFGKHYEFSATSPGVATRHFDSFWDAANEAAMSRMYGGIHFSFANQDGLKLGEDVADWVLENFAETSADAVALTGIGFSDAVLG
jgi:membrane-associated phospholipid phosphatase